MELLSAGRISGTHHLKGAVKVISSFEELKKLKGQKIVVETESGETRVLTVKTVKHLLNSKWIMEFEEVENKNDATLILNSTLKVRRDILGVSEEVLIQDIIGMKVYLEDGESIGEVVDIYETSAHDIFVIEDLEYETMIPDVDEFIKKIDFENNRMIVKLIDGLRERKKDQ